jgi:hypothetical protein
MELCGAADEISEELRRLLSNKQLQRNIASEELEIQTFAGEGARATPATPLDACFRSFRNNTHVEIQSGVV